VGKRIEQGRRGVNNELMIILFTLHLIYSFRPLLIVGHFNVIPFLVFGVVSSHLEVFII
jgi:hypothetical protein